MADWSFNSTGVFDFGSVTYCKPTLGDAFSPQIPSDKLSTINWVVSGSVKLYSADMEFIGEYTRGQRMMVPDPRHRELNKAVLISSSNDTEYYCMSGKGCYLDGNVYDLLPNQELTINDAVGKNIFISSGNLISPKVYPKYQLIEIQNSDTVVIQAGEEGAVVTVFWKI